MAATRPKTIPQNSDEINPAQNRILFLHALLLFRRRIHAITSDRLAKPMPYLVPILLLLSDNLAKGQVHLH
jgi:hypothetical protein